MPAESGVKLNINEIYTCLQGEGKYVGVPHILIRMSGCALRCQFANSICDTPFSSWTPEKNKFTIEQISKIYEENPQIHYTMITGGGPTNNPPVLRLLSNMAKAANHFVTIETEGSVFVQTSADFISLSPKLSNSTPKEGIYNLGRSVKITKEMVEKHEALRKNYEAMSGMIRNHPDYQLKFVVSHFYNEIKEIMYIVEQLQVPKSKVYLMPEGITEEQLKQSRQYLMERAIEWGFNYTDRLHIIAYDNRRGV